MNKNRYELGIVEEDESSIVYRVSREMIEDHGNVYFMRLSPEYAGKKKYPISLLYETQIDEIKKLVRNYGTHFVQFLIRRSYDIELENGLLYIPKELFIMSGLYVDKNGNSYSKLIAEVHKGEKQIALFPKSNCDIGDEV